MHSCDTYVYDFFLPTREIKTVDNVNFIEILRIEFTAIFLNVEHFHETTKSFCKRFSGKRFRICDVLLFSWCCRCIHQCGEITAIRERPLFAALYESTKILLLLFLRVSGR